jgi:hypothetical protein
MVLYAQLCGWTLARAHARSGDRIADFAETYADQNERDYAALSAAVAAGRIEAQSGL